MELNTPTRSDVRNTCYFDAWDTYDVFKRQRKFRRFNRTLNEATRREGPCGDLQNCPTWLFGITHLQDMSTQQKVAKMSCFIVLSEKQNAFSNLRMWYYWKYDSAPSRVWYYLFFVHPQKLLFHSQSETDFFFFDRNIQCTDYVNTGPRRSSCFCKYFSLDTGG